MTDKLLLIVEVANETYAGLADEESLDLESNIAIENVCLVQKYQTTDGLVITKLVPQSYFYHKKTFLPYAVESISVASKIFETNYYEVIAYNKGIVFGPADSQALH